MFRFIRTNSGSQPFILDTVDWVENRVKRSLQNQNLEFDELDSDFALR